MFFVGPEPLKELLESVENILQKMENQYLNVRAIVDIMNLIGKCVISGLFFWCFGFVCVFVCVWFCLLAFVLFPGTMFWVGHTKINIK